MTKLVLKQSVKAHVVRYYMLLISNKNTSGDLGWCGLHVLPYMS